MTQTWRDPIRSIKPELLGRLEMISNHVTPLPGGTGRRIDGPDPRLTKLQDVKGDEISYYEHIASVRDRLTNRFYVAFRETPDALFLRSKDPIKYPEWVMKSREKIKECMIYVYQVFRHPKDVAVMRSHEDWLAPILDPAEFDTVVYYLSKEKVITAEQYERFK